MSRDIAHFSPTASPWPAFTVDRLTPSDGERLRTIRLRALCDAPDAFASTWADAVARPAAEWGRQLHEIPTFVAVANGCDLGMVRGALHDCERGIGYLLSMWVAPEARRRRVGAALVDAVIDWARSAGLNELLLDVAEHNLPAIAFYSARGFVPNGVTGTLPPPREQIRELQMVLRV